jgi:hypothetical protein
MLEVSAPVHFKGGVIPEDSAATPITLEFESILLGMVHMVHSVHTLGKRQQRTTYDEIGSTQLTGKIVLFPRAD